MLHHYILLAALFASSQPPSHPFLRFYNQLRLRPQ